MKELFKFLGSIILFILVIFICAFLVNGQREKCENNGGKYIDNFGVYDSCIYE